MTVDMEKLAPCPFCGCAPYAIGGDQPGARIICPNEDCLGPSTTAYNLSDAIAQWNTRTASRTASAPPSREEIARAIWMVKPDCDRRPFPLDALSPKEVRGLQHNPIASLDLCFIYADAVIALLPDCSEIERLKRERDDALADAREVEAANRVHVGIAKVREQLLARQATTIAQMREALEPFAKEASEWADTVPDSHRSLCTEPGSETAHPGSETAFTVGDLRRAAALSSAPAPAEEPAGQSEAVKDTWLVGGPDLKAMSGSVESDRTIQLHFRRRVTDEDRKWLLDAINEKIASAATPTRSAEISAEDWQTIETAPKNGTTVLLASTHPNGTKQLIECQWWSAERCAAYEGGNPEDYDAGWYQVEDPDDSFCRPTHWRWPLARPTTSIAEAGNG